MEGSSLEQLEEAIPLRSTAVREGASAVRSIDSMVLWRLKCVRLSVLTPNSMAQFTSIALGALGSNIICGSPAGSPDGMQQYTPAKQAPPHIQPWVKLR